MKRLIVFLTLIALATPLFSESPSWPRWRGPNGDGTSSETGWNPKALESGAKVAWKVDIGFGYSDVVIQDGHLYTMGLVEGKWMFHCLDAGSGKRIWQRSLDSAMEPMSTPCIDGDRVYGLGKDGTVVCLKASNGKLIWKKSLYDTFHLFAPSYGWASSPVVEGKLLLLSAGRAGLALDKMTGTLAWASSRGTEVSAGAGYYATPVVCDFDGKRCGLFYGELYLSAMDLASGKLMWACLSHQLHPTTEPIVSGKSVFLSQLDETRLLEMAPDKPATIWSNSSLTSITNGPVMVEGFVYGSHNGFLGFPGLAWDKYGAAAVPIRCVEFASGKVMWESPQKMQYTSVCAAAGRLIFLELGGTLHIAEASPDAYREISSADVLGGEKRPRRFAVPPVLCGGRIYCRNYAGDLVCIDVSK